MYASRNTLLHFCHQFKIKVWSASAGFFTILFFKANEAEDHIKFGFKKTPELSDFTSYFHSLSL